MPEWNADKWNLKKDGDRDKPFPGSGFFIRISYQNNEAKQTTKNGGNTKHSQPIEMALKKIEQREAELARAHRKIEKMALVNEAAQREGRKEIDRAYGNSDNERDDVKKYFIERATCQKDNSDGNDSKVCHRQISKKQSRPPKSIDCDGTKTVGEPKEYNGQKCESGVFR